MPYIIPNNLLTPTEKVIKPYNCSMIAVNGPQIMGKLNMEGIEIPYESQFTSQMTLNEEAINQPVLYGFLGNEVTFLMIKATYVPNDPNWEIESDQYIEYYFADDTTTIRHMGKLLLLTGNSTNRIPQIYLNNPSITQKVNLEIFVANQEQDDLSSTSGLLQNINLITGLYYNNIISDSYLTGGTYGSTSLYITDINNNVQLVIPYININTIECLTDNNIYELIIGNESKEKIYLRFLNEFNMYQAYSRINWVIKNKTSRILTKTSPTIDTEYPVITWNSGITSSGYTSITTGDTTYIIDTFISGVTDNRDGEISKYDTDLTIYKENNLIPLTGITKEGQYTLYFKVSDISNNSNTSKRYAMVDNIPPVIKFKTIASGNTFSMSISNNTTSGTFITTGDTRLYTIQSVTDNVYSGLTISDVIVTISGDTCNPCSTVDTSGLSYTISYSLSDYVGNTSNYQKTMNTIS